MNKENAKLYIPLMEALADGELQFFNDDEWQDSGEPCFSEPPSHYRRKPKPTVAPWTLETCPVGAVVKHKDTRHRYLIKNAHDTLVYE